MRHSPSGRQLFPSRPQQQRRSDDSPPRSLLMSSRTNTHPEEMRDEFGRQYHVRSYPHESRLRSPSPQHCLHRPPYVDADHPPEHHLCDRRSSRTFREYRDGQHGIDRRPYSHQRRSRSSGRPYRDPYDRRDSYHRSRDAPFDPTDSYQHRSGYRGEEEDDPLDGRREDAARDSSYRSSPTRLWRRRSLRGMEEDGWAKQVVRKEEEKGWSSIDPTPAAQKNEGVKQMRTGWSVAPSVQQQPSGEQQMASDTVSGAPRHARNQDIGPDLRAVHNQPSGDSPAAAIVALRRKRSRTENEDEVVENGEIRTAKVKHVRTGSVEGEAPLIESNGIRATGSTAGEEQKNSSQQERIRQIDSADSMTDGQQRVPGSLLSTQSALHSNPTPLEPELATTSAAPGASDMNPPFHRDAVLSCPTTVFVPTGSHKLQNPTTPTLVPSASIVSVSPKIPHRPKLSTPPAPPQSSSTSPTTTSVTHLEPSPTLDSVSPTEEGPGLPLDSLLLRKEIILRLQLALRHCNFNSETQEKRLNQSESTVEALHHLASALLDRLLESNRQPATTVSSPCVSLVGEQGSEVSRTVEECRWESIGAGPTVGTAGVTTTTLFTPMESDGTMDSDRTMEPSTITHDACDGEGLELTKQEQDGIVQEQLLGHDTQSMAVKSGGKEEDATALLRLKEEEEARNVDQLLEEMSERVDIIDEWVRRNCSMMDGVPNHAEASIDVAIQDLLRTVSSDDSCMMDSDGPKSLGRRVRNIDGVESVQSPGSHNSNRSQKSNRSHNSSRSHYSRSLMHHGATAQESRKMRRREDRLLRVLAAAHVKLKRDYRKVRKENLVAELELQTQKQKLAMYLSRDPEVWEIELPVLKQSVHQLASSPRQSDQPIELTKEDIVSFTRCPDGQLASIAKLKRIIRFLRNANAKRDKAIDELKAELRALETELRACRSRSSSSDETVLRRFSHHPGASVGPHPESLMVFHKLQEQRHHDNRILLMENAALRAQVEKAWIDAAQRIQKTEEDCYRREQRKVKPVIVSNQDRIAELEGEMSKSQLRIIELMKENDFLKVQLEETQLLDGGATCLTILDKIIDANALWKTNQSSPPDVPKEVGPTEDVLTQDQIDSTVGGPKRHRDIRVIEGDQLTVALEKTVKEVKVLKGKLKSITDKGFSLLSDQVDARRLVSDFQLETERLQARIDELEEELGQTQKERNEAQSISSMRLDEQKNLHERIAKEIEEVAKRQIQLEDSQSLVTHLQDTVEAQKGEMERLVERQKELESCVDSLQMDVLHARYPTASSSTPMLPELEIHSVLARKNEPSSSEGKLSLFSSGPSFSSSAYQQLQEEFDALRSKVLCCLCREQFSNSLLKKCGHVFCHECVKSTLGSRNRKCPSCNQRFQTDDVIRVFFT